MKKDFTNKDVAELLKQVAAAYTVKNEDRFRIIAYERAAASIERAASEVKDLWDDGKLDEIAGIGPSIASHLDELFRTGKVKHFEEVKSGLPKAMFEFLSIPGIGAKTAFKLCDQLKINDSKKAMARLEKAAKSGKIRIIPGFGEESEKDLLEGIKAFRAGQTKEKRMLLPYADSLAHEIIDYLLECPAVTQINALGSLRRKVSTIGDIDIAVETEKPNEVIQWFTKYSKIKRILGKGEEALVRIILDNGRQIDLRLQTPDSYGAMLQYLTGGKAHNIALRKWAHKKGMSLSEYGIKKVQNSKLKIRNYHTEEEFYQALGLDWIPPELREDTGEIEAAYDHKLPTLIELKQIKGDLHLHSDFPIETSHDLGINTIEEIVKRADDLGYEYIGFSEHNPSSSKHNDREIISILKEKKAQIDQLNYSCEKRTNKLFIHAYNGLEIDIKPNGELAIPEKGFEFLDYAIASIHSSFRMTRDEMTKRVIKGLDHPKVKIFGHPTGRKLNDREGYELDWERIFDFCLEKNKWLEINAWPDRLDLPDSLVREAVKKKVKMIICTDSHEITQLDLMEYGVEVARRGWAEKSDIINTLGIKEFSKELKREKC